MVILDDTILALQMPSGGHPPHHVWRTHDYLAGHVGEIVGRRAVQADTLCRLKETLLRRRQRSRWFFVHAGDPPTSHSNCLTVIRNGWGSLDLHGASYPQKRGMKWSPFFAPPLNSLADNARRVG
jgi:hypothetical protein